jgi:heme A synthase
MPATARITAAAPVLLGGVIGGWAVLATAAGADVLGHEVVGVTAAIAAVAILARLVRRIWAPGAGGRA